MKRKNYSKEFKFQAVSLIVKEKHPVRFVSKQLEVHENTLYRRNYKTSSKKTAKIYPLFLIQNYQEKP
ncbi:transposase [Listeria immobilis]|uniref:transposase n=1 Tax=Listeria immobilis TaxID=2713502 RepID=UPI00162847FE|nr:transposase [Listeria immobilis]